MKRRTFIKKSIGAAAIPVLGSSMPLRLFSNELMQLMASSTNDNVVVMIQLMGGNDGLNTIIPLGQYDLYKESRPNIAIPETGNRRYIKLNPDAPLTEQVGVHPDMEAFKEMFDEKMVTIVQNVAYDNPDLSHFRGRDIWFMGGGSNDYWHSGWMGRYLDNTYEGYPEEYPNDQMPDPLGLEFGYSMSLAFQREEGIPAGLAIIDPDTFYQIVSGSGVSPPDWLPDSYYGDELKYIMDMELTSNQYAGRIKEVHDLGTNSADVDYPEEYPGEVIEAYKKNDLAWQLKTVARLISGGSKTKLFIVKINGFDTHADQTLASDPTQGIHAALLYHLSSSVKAFYADLKDQGFDKKLLTFTISEFGRRVDSNGSFGTDHGMAAPVLLFGPMLKNQIIGDPADLSNLNDGNLNHQYDYRQIYTSILADWLNAPPEIVDAVGWNDFMESRLDLFHGVDGTEEYADLKKNHKLSIYPNPARTTTNIKLWLATAVQTRLVLNDLNGHQLIEIYNGFKQAGEYTMVLDVSGLKSGYYVIQLMAGKQLKTNKLLVL